MEEDGHGSFGNNIQTFICSVQGQKEKRKKKKKTHTHTVREPGSPVKI